MISELATSLDLVDWQNPVNRSHPLNRGLKAWYLSIPGRMGFGSKTWRNLCIGNDASLESLTPSTAWKLSPRQVGSIGSLYLSTYASIPDRNYGIANGYTIAASVLGASGANKNFIGRDDSAGERFWQARFVSTGALNFIRFNSSNSVVTSITSASTYSSATTMYRVMMTFTGSGSAIYVNGKLDGSDSVTTANRDGTGTVIALGARSGEQNTLDPYVNNIDHVCIWNRGFNAAEARLEYQSSLRGSVDRLNRIPLPLAFTAPAAGGTILPMFNHYQCSQEAD